MGETVSGPDSGDAERAGAVVPSAQGAADALRVSLSRGDEDRTFAVVLEIRDRLRGALPHRDNQAPVAAAWAACPAGVQGRWLVLLAAFVHFEFERADAEPPAWTVTPRLPAPWVLDTPRLTKTQIRKQTPMWLAARNIYIAVKDLGTV